MEVIEQLKNLTNKLLNSEKIILESDSFFWKIKFAEKGAGVYILRNKDNKIVYVGETGTIKHRVKDLLHTHNHSFRRAIFKKYFINENGVYNDYKASKKRISEYICKEFTYSYLEVSFGRKELEEYIISNASSEFLLNSQKNKLK